jgi:hypothetical protein
MRRRHSGGACLLMGRPQQRSRWRRTWSTMWWMLCSTGADPPTESPTTAGLCHHALGSVGKTATDNALFRRVSRAAPSGWSC